MTSSLNRQRHRLVDYNCYSRTERITGERWLNGMDLVRSKGTSQEVESDVVKVLLV